jgi:hypothetical protein
VIVVSSNYPCNCENMVWMINNSDIFKFQDSAWVLHWIELDKGKDGTTSIERFGVRFQYCMFCGRSINNNGLTEELK